MSIETTRADHAKELEVIGNIGYDDFNDDELDPDYLIYMQDEFQNELIELLFYDICEYIEETKARICGFLTRDKIEEILNALTSL